MSFIIECIFPKKIGKNTLNIFAFDGREKIFFVLLRNYSSENQPQKCDFLNTFAGRFRVQHKKHRYGFFEIQTCVLRCFYNKILRFLYVKVFG